MAYEISPSLVTVEGHSSKQAAALLDTAGAIFDQHLGQGRRGLAVCGVSSGVGVTFVASNLAMAFAHMGIPTLLVDANLRRPGVSNVIAPTASGPGLADVLAGDARLADVMHHDVLPNLSVVYAGQVAATSGELISTAAFRPFIEACLREHACVLVDTPSGNRYAEVRRICSVVGYALLVAKRGVTYAEDLALFSDELDIVGATLVGAVLNGA